MTDRSIRTVRLGGIPERGVSAFLDVELNTGRAVALRVENRGKRSVRAELGRSDGTGRRVRLTLPPSCSSSRALLFASDIEAAIGADESVTGCEFSLTDHPEPASSEKAEADQ